MSAQSGEVRVECDTCLLFFCLRGGGGEMQQFCQNTLSLAYINKNVSTQQKLERNRGYFDQLGRALVVFAVVERLK